MDDEISNKEPVLIPIEERSGDEIAEGFGLRTAPVGIKTYNPAFDVTPAELITAIVTERGVVRRPDDGSLGTLPEDARGDVA